MPITPLASRPHDHSHCVHTALSEADTLCGQKGLRLTALRRRVLELVWQSHKPLGAYDILAVLSEQDGRRAAPPAVYRALVSLLNSTQAGATLSIDSPRPLAIGSLLSALAIALTDRLMSHSSDRH